MTNTLQMIPLMNRLSILPLLLLGTTPLFAEPVTAERIEKLPATEQAEWKSYLERSQAAAKVDQAALDKEVAASGLTSAIKPSDGGDFKLSFKGGDPWFAGAEAKALADIVLSYQTPSGGWSKHTGYSKGARKAGMQWSSQYEPGMPPHYLATFDNRSTTEQLYFLAYLWQATQREDLKAPFAKGLDFILAAQYPDGGWPQTYPLEGKYHDDLTFNDDATTRVLALLQEIGSGKPWFAFLTDAQREKAAAALKKGIQCVVNAQIEQDGKKTVWCAQYDPITLQPSNARAMEPATLSGLESSRILKFLMSLPKPSPEVVAAIEAGLAWYDKARVTGLKKSEIDGKATYVADPASTEVYWARFYDLKTGAPVFPGRDGVLYKTYDEMAAKNKVGYDFYTTLPNSVVTTGQKKWRTMLEKQAAAN
jgi:PelA/Pel-15E family pectate lyase